MSSTQRIRYVRGSKKLPFMLSFRGKIKLFGLPIEMSAYIDILAALGISGYRDEQLSKEGVVDYGDDHFTCFQFDYDWRRDNVENTLRLWFILRSSALMDERLGGTWSPTLISPITWRQVLFLFTEHLAMTKDPAFTDNLLFLLLEQPRNHLKKSK
ncbi:hypothetical protein IIC38_16870 [candidate division KSB1 bacterium]|nr:hypothetical protein [candidate division KSB1 bacterium]